MTSRTTVISVCFNSSAVIGRMLETLPSGVPVVLVDNGSDDLEAVRALAVARGATLVENGMNLGFGTACNRGAARAETEFLLFLNPDTEVGEGAIAALEAGADRYPQASAFNPAFLNRKGQPGYRRTSVLLPRRQWLPRGQAEADMLLPILSGAAMLIRREAFQRIGGFDERIFLYHEDDDLSLRLKADCGPLMYLRAAEMRHIGGQSSPRSPAVAALKARHMGRSRVYAARKHAQRFGFLRALGSAIGQLLSPLLLFSARKRAKQWAFLRGVWEGRSV